MLQLTKKRRENLAKITINLITIDMTGLVMPFILRREQINVTILASGIISIFIFIWLVYYLEK